MHQPQTLDLVASATEWSCGETFKQIITQDTKYRLKPDQHVPGGEGETIGSH